MARLQSLTALVALAASLSACSGNSAGVASASNRGLDSINQPVVQRSDYVLDLPASYDGLAAGERGRLSAWFASLELGYGDRVWVDEAQGPTRARDHVARVAADYGLLLSDGAPVTAGGVEPGAIRVIVSRSTATVPNCPNWERTGGPSSTSSNYGCAVNSNLAAMVADPSDLVLGQAGSGTDAKTASKAIKVYRDTAPTGAKGLGDTSTKGGN
ncbi:MAG TPA: CpaD family pilus assembly protein [Allosphingosinicella sp.]